MRPTIVCLCGSTRFKDAYLKAQRDETLKGKIVLSVGLFGHEEGLDMDGPTKKMLDKLHLAKIDLADEVLFLNLNGYIGESTKKELAYASKAGKLINFLEPMDIGYFSELTKKFPMKSPAMDDEKRAICELCGEPMPPGEEMFKFHGYSGNCPKTG